MASDPPLRLRQRFREAGMLLFGRGGAEWVVRDLFVGTDDLWYARVVLVVDPSQSKTLSVAVLTDRHRFTPN